MEDEHIDAVRLDLRREAGSEARHKALGGSVLHREGRRHGGGGRGCEDHAALELVGDLQEGRMGGGDDWMHVPVSVCVVLKGDGMAAAAKLCMYVCMTDGQNLTRGIVARAAIVRT